MIRQKIKLEPNDSATLFGIRPMLDATSAHRFSPSPEHQRRHPVSARSAGGDYEYEVISDADPNGSPAARVSAGRIATSSLLSIPADLQATAARDRRAAGRERSTAEGQRRHRRPAPAGSKPFCAIPASSATPCRWTSKDPKLDPVEDFLVNRKKGHCEYFASALALLLRSIDIPSRIVNGFKGGDWNELTETMNVRQKHAHSWVEAYIGLRPENGPDLDHPRPDARHGTARVDRPGRRSRRQLPPAHRRDPPHLGLLHRRLRRRTPESPALRADAHDRSRGAGSVPRALGSWLRKWFTRLFHFQNISAFISIRGFIVTFVVLTLAAGLANLAFRLAQRLLRGSAARRSTRPRSRPESSFTGGWSRCSPPTSWSALRRRPRASSPSAPTSS